MNKNRIDPVKLLKSLHSIQNQFLQEDISFDTLFDKLLEVLLDLTGSEYGFIGRILNNGKQKYLKTYAITDISWNAETAKFYKDNAPDGLEFYNLETLFGWVIKNEEVLMTNDAPNHQESSGIPHGHPPLEKFLGIPIKFNQEMIGMVGIANRPVGYDKDLVKDMEPYFSSCATLINHKIVSDEKDYVENTLERFKIALDETALVSVANKDGEITYANDKFIEISGYDKNELLGQSHRIINSGYHEKSFFTNMWSTITNGDIWKGIVKNKAKDGSYYWVSSTIVPFFDKDGKPVEYLAIRHDITQQKQSEEMLARKNAELDNFATIVSHDLKAPLRGINTMVEFMEDDLPDLDEDIQENFDMLKSRVKRLNSFIDGLLEYSRIGRTEIIFETVNFNEVLDETIDNLSLAKNVHINLNNSLPTAYSSKLLLGQMFANLISNSVKHCDKPEVQIDIDYIDLGNYFELHFKDNGPGIPPELREKVFQIFQTIKSKDESDSTGVGLSIVKKISTELNGSIYIDENNHEGTNFVLVHPK